MRLSFLLFLFVVAGCAPYVKKHNSGAEEKKRYMLECLDDEKYCDPQAKEFCPNGYKVVDEKSNVIAIWRGVDVVNRIRFYLEVECEE